MINTLKFAKLELEKYYFKITNEKLNEKIVLSVDSQLKDLSSSINFDLKLDEFWEIDVKYGKGTIKGVNERSVLFAVYRFLYLCGCRFLAPPVENEIIVKKSVNELNVTVKEQPTSRYRGVVIEGAASLEHVLSMIDHSAKNCLNTYFVQGKNGYVFFKRWYENYDDPKGIRQVFSETQAEIFIKEIEKEVSKRSLMYHKGGHGWNSDAIEAEKYGWGKVDKSYNEIAFKELIAETNGNRKLRNMIPVDTNLCYSNPIARDIFNDKIISYIEKNSNIDTLHIWLADGVNNHCECNECQKSTPSDWYLVLLNDLDKKLSVKKNNQKIAFLIYVDLLQPPIKERLNNPDRFTLMFAPIARSYLSSYKDNLIKAKQQEDKFKRFPLNKTDLLTGVDSNIAYLNLWKQNFVGESFVFEYHQMWEIYKDYGHMHLSKILYDDILTLPKLNLQGMLSCQVQRSFYPHGFLMYVLSQTLLNNKISYEYLLNDYFIARFGEYGKLVSGFFIEVSKATPFEYTRNETDSLDNRFIDEFKKLNSVLKNGLIEFEKINDERIIDLKDYIEALILLSDLMVLKLQGESIGNLTNLYNKNVRSIIYKIEEKHEYLDALICDLIFGITVKDNWKALNKNFNN